MTMEMSEELLKKTEEMSEELLKMAMEMSEELLKTELLKMAMEMSEELLKTTMEMSEEHPCRSFPELLDEVQHEGYSDKKAGRGSEECVGPSGVARPSLTGTQHLGTLCCCWGRQ
ncbi:hypothetical protein TrRE_jg552 [Triparma retinervis]|uniref:Uncharacterized protein n=1 Tax=Triparma retinervis TaxID=2557542 RepID=A0A9W7CIL5_9STRA|nr:hypothetical protein TrRE_jg552 [Triparma retinervis]